MKSIDYITLKQKGAASITQDQNSGEIFLVVKHYNSHTMELLPDIQDSLNTDQLNSQRNGLQLQIDNINAVLEDINALPPLPPKNEATPADKLVP